jgi:hypothetical protein
MSEAQMGLETSGAGGFLCGNGAIKNAKCQYSALPQQGIF